MLKNVQKIAVEQNITCGVIVTDGNSFIVAHPTNAKWKKAWSVPKGIKDEGETLAEAASRELFEETTLKISPNNLKLLIKDKYRPGKDIAIFIAYVDELPNKESLRCDSTFNFKGKMIPECDAFAIIPFSKYPEYLNYSQKVIFDKLVEQKLINI